MNVGHVPSGFIAGAHILRGPDFVVAITEYRYRSRQVAHALMTDHERALFAAALGGPCQMWRWLTDRIITPPDVPLGLRCEGLIYDGAEVIAPPPGLAAAVDW